MCDGEWRLHDVGGLDFDPLLKAIQSIVVIATPQPSLVAVLQ